MSEHDRVNRNRRAILRAGGALALGAALRPSLARAQTSGKARIGVIGSGHIGGTIGALWIKNGHQVVFSSRHPDELKEVVEGLGAQAQAATVGQAIELGEVIFIAVPYGGVVEVGKQYGPELKGKIVLDACNAVPPRDDAALVEEVERDGIGIVSQRYLPGTRLVRAFNCTNYKIFASEANRPDPRLGVPVAGDDVEAVQVAAGLVRDAGFEPVLAGKLADARRFQRGTPIFGKALTAAELKQQLSLAQ